ncbi:MAG: OsmC family protein [Sandaracinaceae bacterium]|nr:OsmC family protein [Sandaracinaceae bacterium]
MLNPMGETAAAIDAGVVVVRGRRSGLGQDVRVGAHQLRADEPITLGGTDTGPSPYDYLLAALGACTSMTLRLYADRKRWPLEGVTVHLRHSRIHAADCADCDTKKGMIEQVEREIELAGPLDDEQKSRLLEIADRCPVHRTLTAEMRIDTRLR